jgi:uncharacterized protein
MLRIKKAWLYWFQEPIIWLLRCFFQPANFHKDFEMHNLVGRLKTMLRLTLPIFLCAYPLVLISRVILYTFSPELFTYHIQWGVPWQTDMLLFVFDATWATAVSSLIGGLLGGIFGVEEGIAFAMAASLADGIIINSLSDNVNGIVFGGMCGLILGLTMNSLGALKRSGLKNTTSGILIGILVGIVIGTLIGTFVGYWSGIAVGILGRPMLQEVYNNVGAITGLLISAFASAMVLYIIGNVVKSALKQHIEVVDVATKMGIAVACSFGGSIGIATGDAGMKLYNFSVGIQTGFSGGMFAGAAFLLCYLPSYFRLPLYPFSAISMGRAYFNSQRDPIHVFHYLHHCAIYSDECVFLPLPYMKQILLIAANQDSQATRDEIDFIIHERPQQLSGAREAALEMVLHDLSMRESLRDISRAYQSTATILPKDIRLMDHAVAHLFRYLDDASRDAMSYYSRVGTQARREALESMQANLKKVYPTSAFREASLNRQLENVLTKWRVVATHEQENVKKASANLRQIENPYTPGMALELRDPLFVGRRDLAQQLSEALRRGRRPTFFLTGERRMGKSSVLKQLPDLLGSHYLPIFYDLQSTGDTSSTAALLATIAEGIYSLLTIKGMLIRELTYDQLRENQRENEAVVYHSFNRWLKDIERILERDDQTLLLAFDEFEKLQEAGQKGHIDLQLLLNWFRSVIQNRSRLALLFSGVKMANEMGASWSGYFVNVETLKVSFLQPDEARHLIIHPVAQFPGEHIFSEEVVAEIMKATGCHPFLLQAVCSSIVENLNHQGRQRATPGDVSIAIEEVFMKWGDNYFSDLWERTDEEQRNCLLVVGRLGRAGLERIQQASPFDNLTTQRSLQRLVKRDLLLYGEDTYRVAAPIFEKWARQGTSL